MLQYCTTTSTKSRLRLFYFLYSVRMEESYWPAIGRLSTALQVKLIKESITTPKENKLEVELNQFVVQQMPTFMTEFLLIKLKLMYYPSDYLLVENDNIRGQNLLLINMNGDLKLGYGKDFLMQRKTSRKRTVFCWREFLMDNQSLHHDFRIQTRSLTLIYQISSDWLLQAIKKQK